MKVSVALIDS